MNAMPTTLIHPPHTRDSLHASRPLILVVDDVPANLMVATGYLEILNCDFDTAVNGQEAVDLVRSGKIYTTIFMDIMMPGLNGFDATRMIRQFELDHHLDRTPIIAVTAWSRPRDCERCFAAGMDDSMAKPYTLDQLRQKIWWDETPGTAPRDDAMPAGNPA